MLAEHVAGAVLGHQHDERGREPGQRMAAESGALLPDLPLDADRDRQDQRERQFTDFTQPWPANIRSA